MKYSIGQILKNIFSWFIIFIIMLAIIGIIIIVAVIVLSMAYVVFDFARNYG